MKFSFQLIYTYHLVALFTAYEMWSKVVSIAHKVVVRQESI